MFTIIYNDPASISNSNPTGYREDPLGEFEKWQDVMPLASKLEREHPEWIGGAIVYNGLHDFYSIYKWNEKHNAIP